LDNILVKKMLGFLGMVNYCVAICDFSLTFSQVSDNIRGDFNPGDLDFIQTVNYRSPELLLGNTDFTYKIDIWSMGIVILKLVTDIDFFRGDNTKSQRGYLCRFFSKKEVASYCQRKSLDVDLPVKNFLSQKAKTIAMINDPLLRDLVSRMLTLDGCDRIGLGEIFRHPYFSHSNLAYPFKERQSRLFLDNYFREHSVQPLHRVKSIVAGTLERSCKARFELFLSVYRFLINQNLSIRILLQSIYLFDYLARSGRIEPTKMTFIAVLRILGYQRFYSEELLTLINHPSSEASGETLLEAFEERYYVLLAQIKDQIRVPSYLDYLELTGLDIRHYQTNRHETLWVLMLLLVANPEHYQGHQGLSLVKSLLVLEQRILPDEGASECDRQVARWCRATLYELSDGSVLAGEAIENLEKMADDS
jgi:serine/threonine protein kinase